MLKKLSLLFICLLLFSANRVMAQIDYCEGNFDCDRDQDSTDATKFKSDSGRSNMKNPCPVLDDCSKPWAPCPQGMLICSNKCVDPMTDGEHCGAAEGCINGVACQQNEICSNGICTPWGLCPEGQIDCGGSCIDPLKDREHCGADADCLNGYVCEAGEICSSGVCMLSCPPNLTNCSGTCVDTDTDERNCGGCGVRCYFTCIDGSCQQTPAECDGYLTIGNRWCDQGNGTVKDMTTGLVWLKDAGWGGMKQWINTATWDDAHTRAGTLHSGIAGLTDGSIEGDWRLPTKSELVGILSGNECIREDEKYFFINVQIAYWTSTTSASNPSTAWAADTFVALVGTDAKSSAWYVWPVRRGQ